MGSTSGPATKRDRLPTLTAPPTPPPPPQCPPFDAPALVALPSACPGSASQRLPKQTPHAQRNARRRRGSPGSAILLAYGSPPGAARPPVDDADLCGAFDRPRVQRAVPPQPGEGPDGAEHRVRPPDPDRL